MKSLNSNTRRVTAIFCALSVLLMFIFIPIASAETKVYGFEGAVELPGSGNSFANSNVSLNTALENVRSGSQSVKLGNFTGANTTPRVLRVVDETQNPKTIKLTKDTEYTLTWYYKVNELSHKMNFVVYSSTLANATTGTLRTQQTLDTQYSIDVTPSTSPSGWVKCEARFTAKADADTHENLVLGLLLDNTSVSGTITMDVYLDDILCEEYDPDAPAFYGFEGITAFGANQKSGNVSLNNVAANVRTGTQSAKFGKIDSNPAPVRLVQARDDTQIPAQMKVEHGKNYKLTWWYKINKLELDAQIQVYATSLSIVNSNDTSVANGQPLRQIQTLSESRLLQKDGITTSWEKMEVTFTAALNHADHNNIAIGMVLVNPTGTAYDMDIYFDDVVIEEIPGPSEDLTGIYSFEDYDTQIQSGMISSQTGVALSKTEYYSGKQSFEYSDPGGTNYSAPRLGILEDGTLKAKVIEGQKYKLIFRYKVLANISVSAKFEVYTTNSGDVVNGVSRRVQEISPGLTFTTATNGWEEAEIIFTAKIKEDKPEFTSLAIGVLASAGIGTKIYFDHFKLEEVAEDLTGVYGFEDYSEQIKNADTRSSMSGVRLSTTEKYSGSQSFEYFNPGSNYTQPRLVILEDGNLKAAVADGQAYKLTFRYKVSANISASAQFELYTTHPSDVTNWSSRQLQEISPSVTFTAATNGWAQAEIIFTAKVLEGQPTYTSLAIGVLASADIGTSIFFDHFKLEETAEDLTDTYSFEGFTAFGSDEKSGNVTLNTDAANVRTGSKSAKFGDILSNPAPVRLVQARDDTQAPNRMQLEHGKTYKLTWWYKIKNLQLDANIQVYATIAGQANTDANNARKLQDLEITPTLQAGTVTSGWTKLEVIFTADLYSATHNHVAIGMKLVSPTATAYNMEVYFDDIKIEEHDPGTLTPVETYSFEDYSGPLGDNRTSLTGISLSTDAFHGTKSLKYSDPGTNYPQPRLFMIQEGSQKALLTAGESYKVTLRYKIPQNIASDISANLVVFTARQTDVTNGTGRQEQYISPELNFKNATNGWVEFSFAFNTRILAGNPTYTALALGVQANGNIGTEILFDDIRIETTAPIEEPPPLDMNNPVYDFEKFGYSPNSAALSLTGVTISDDYARSGSKSMKFYIPEDNVQKGDRRVGTPNTVTLEKTDNRFRMEAGGVYLVSFWYYLENAPAQEIEITLWSTSNSAMSPSRRQLQTSFFLKLNSSSTSGKWVKYTQAVYAEFFEEDPDSNYLTMSFRLPGSETEPPVYIDDFEVLVLDPTQVHLVLSDPSGTEPTHISGAPGSPVTLPTDRKYNARTFGGWFTDLKGEDEFTDAAFTENMVLNAKWILTYLNQDFEKYPYSTVPGHGYDLDLEIYNSSVKGFNPDNVYSGANSIHRIGKIEYAKRFTLMDKAEDSLPPGTIYKMTFYVKVESTTALGSLPLEVLPLRVPDKTISNDGEYQELFDLRLLEMGFWYKATVIVESKDAYLAIRTPGNTSIYFDNFTLESVPADTVLKEEMLVKLSKSGNYSPDGKTPEDGEVNDDEIVPKTGSESYLLWIMITLISSAALIIITEDRRRAQK